MKDRCGERKEEEKTSGATWHASAQADIRVCNGMLIGYRIPDENNASPLAHR